MSNTSLRSARLYSIAILVLGYVGFSFVWQHQERLTTLSQARLAMASIIAASVGTDFPALGEIELGDIVASGDFYHVNVTVRRRGGGQWGVARLPVPQGTDEQKQQYDRSLEQLGQVAAQVGIFDSGNAGASKLYVDIEQRTLGTEVMVPGVGLGFHGMQVVWVCVIATFCFLVITRDRVQHVLSDENLAMSERWLVIDGRDGIEYVLSQLWLAGFILAPTVLSSGLILGVTAQTAVDGATSGLAGDALRMAGVLILLAGNGWLALNTASRILELRGRRLALADTRRA